MADSGLPLYPTGPTTLEPRPEGVNSQDVRRVRRGRHEIDRAVVWSSILHRMHGSVVNEALHYKLQKAKHHGPTSPDGQNPSGVPIHPERNGTDAKRPSKFDWWCCAVCKRKAPPPPEDPSFIVFPQLPLQPEVPATRKQRILACVSAIVASALFGISIFLAQTLIGTFGNSIELVLWYLFTGVILTSIPPYLFFRYVSDRRRKIWGRLLGDEQYINYKRGAMCSVRSLCGIVGLVSEYYAMSFMAPGDTAMVICAAPIYGAIGAMIFRKRKFEWYLLCVAFLPLIGFGFIMLANTHAWEIFVKVDPRYAGVGLGLVAMLSMAVNQYILRFLRYVHPSITQFVFGVTGFIMAVIFCVCNHVTFSVPIGLEVYYFGAYTLTSILAELLWQFAHKYESLATLGLIRFVVEVPIIYTFQLFFHKWKPDVYVGVGGAILGCAVLLWALKECFASSQKKKQTIIQSLAQQ